MSNLNQTVMIPSNVFEVKTRDLSDESMDKALDLHHRLMISAFLLLFHLGLTLFEYGAVRRKSSDLVLIRHFLVFCVATLCTCLFGFHIAYSQIQGSSEVDDFTFGQNLVETDHGRHVNKTSGAL